MKKKLIILLLIIAFLVISISIIRGNRNVETVIDKDTSSVLNEDEKVGSKIELEIEKHDFGEMNFVDIVEHDFQIKNVGDTPLEILRLSTSCGCTSAEMIEGVQVIEPGKNATLRVTFNPSVHKDDQDLGNVKRIVYIKTNDNINPEVEIEISANVLK